MSVMLRIVLLIVSLATAIWILRKIRKNKVKQEDATYWICFAMILAVLGIFPELSYKMSDLLGIVSPANFVFLAIISVLVEKLLSVSIQLSNLENKMDIMAAELAIRCKDLEKQEKKESQIETINKEKSNEEKIDEE